MTLEEAIKNLKELPCYEEDGCGIDCEDCDFQKAINMAIEALKEPKQGEWIFRPYADSTMGDIVCSECDIIYFEGVPESRIKGRLYNFCPICGARMKGGDEK